MVDKYRLWLILSVRLSRSALEILEVASLSLRGKLYCHVHSRALPIHLLRLAVGCMCICLSVLLLIVAATQTRRQKDKHADI